MAVGLSVNVEVWLVFSCYFGNSNPDLLRSAGFKDYGFASTVSK